MRSFLSEDIVNQFEENIDIEGQTNWPSSIAESEYLLACDNCFYPIAKLFNATETSVRKINENTTVSAIFETKFLLTTNLQRITEITTSWQNQIICLICEKLLSYTEENVPEHIMTYSTDNQTAILNFENLLSMQAGELKEYYENSHN